ncbi:MAG: signal peptidase II [Acidimicrobiia bacterium]|nr:signal peptidase II [Acidimicrobiia bacterium]
MKRSGAAAATVGSVLAVDILTKALVVANLEDPGKTLTLIEDFLRFRVSRNPGAAFSLFPDGGVLLGIVAVVTIVVIAAVIGRMDRRSDVMGLALVAGGATGNLIDRIFRGDGFLDGKVIDFIDFSFFPSFNVADSAITVGAVIVIFAAFLGERSSTV